MDQWTEIRRKVLVEGASKRSIHRDYGIGHQALAKILANAEPPGYQMAEIRRKPVLGAHLATIDRILADDKAAPPKQRHTARRIFDRLRDEHGYTGCYSQVYSKEAFVPPSHPPGHAQFAFGEATVEIAGERVKAALGVITLPYSDTYFLSAYPRECTESFEAAHVAGFEFFGAVPVRISYDNTTVAVSKVMEKERALTRGFLTLESHHLFNQSFLPGRPGQREGPCREPRRLLPAQPVGPGPDLRVVGRAERVPAGRLLCRPVPQGPGQDRHQGRTPRRRPRGHAGAAGRVLRAPTGRPGSRQLAPPRAFRPQRLFGADFVCPP
jgi:transposase